MSLFLYGLIYFSFVCVEMLIVLYIAYQISKYIGIHAYIDTVLYFTIVFYLGSLLLFHMSDSYLYLVGYLFMFQFYSDLYFLHNLHILVLFSEKHDVDPLLYVGHSQTWYIITIWLFGTFSLSDIDAMTSHFVECTYMDAPMCYNAEVVNLCLFILAIFFYFLCVYWVVSLGRDARIYFGLINELFFLNYLMYICCMPFIPY